MPLTRPTLSLAGLVNRALRARARWAQKRRIVGALDRVFDPRRSAAASRKIRRTVFFGSYRLSSFKLGGLYPIEALNRMGLHARSGEKVPPESLRDAILVFVKEELPPDLRPFKARGNRIVVDMRDNHIHADGALNPGFVGRDVADRLIFPNQAVRDAFLAIGQTESRCDVLYGFADPEITRSLLDHGIRNYRELRGCYFGFSENLDAGLLGAARGAVPMEQIPLTETDFERHLPRLGACNLHVDLRPLASDNLYKPLTKVLIAAECRSNIIIERSSRSLELLPEDYPFLVDGHDAASAFQRARALFGTAAWHQALAVMERIRQAHSFQNHMHALLGMLEELS